jgi:hypothetical protein
LDWVLIFGDGVFGDGWLTWLDVALGFGWLLLMAEAVDGCCICVFFLYFQNIWQDLAPFQVGFGFGGDEVFE